MSAQPESRSVSHIRPPVTSSFAANDRDALPFRTLELAHRRRRLALQELAAAQGDVARALEGMRAAGYHVRDSEPSDALAEVAPIGDERYRAEL
jgi:hypothetical protein